MNNQYRKTALFLLAALAVAALLAACGGGQAAPPADTPVSKSVIPLTGADAAGNMSVKTADGSAPCGVFNVNGYGDKEVVLADYPGCTAATYQIMCLNDKAEWQATYVSNVSMSADSKQILVTLAQDGVCGLFPAK